MRAQVLVVLMDVQGPTRSRNLDKIKTKEGFEMIETAFESLYKDMNYFFRSISFMLRNNEIKVRIFLCSKIHGHLLAQEAVLVEIKRFLIVANRLDL